MACSRLNKQQASEILAKVDGGMWSHLDLIKMGPINLKNGFKLIARKVGIAINYYCVPVYRF